MAETIELTTGSGLTDGRINARHSTLKPPQGNPGERRRESSCTIHLCCPALCCLQHYSRGATGTMPTSAAIRLPRIKPHGSKGESSLWGRLENAYTPKARIRQRKSALASFGY
jgi:hypothetical protein